LLRLPGVSLQQTSWSTRLFGGTGTVTATVDGQTTSYTVSGAPNIYTVLDRTTEERGTLVLTLTPGLIAYSFTFG
jgi:thioredoxin family protein